MAMSHSKGMLILLAFVPFIASAQITGCTDPLSTNYNPLAEINDGSCLYTAQSLVPESSIALSDTLDETSGLIQWNNEIWTHNDNTDTNLYQINTVNGSVAGIIGLPNVVNTDWEEISQDDNYFYMGDFGNNSSGNRTDLHILRIGKISLANGTPEIDTISFSYSNQTNFTATAGNATNFDCEAFVVSSDSIYLFTKRWIDKKTFLYALSKTPGSHTAILRDSLNVQGLITGATYMEEKDLLVICGYTSALQPFLYTFYDFENQRFFSGNKRRFGISLSYTQVEGITTNDGLRYYISNERFTNGPAAIPQKLHLLDLTDYLHPYLTANLNELETEAGLQIFPNPAKNAIHLSANTSLAGKSYFIADMAGKIIDSGIIASSQINIEKLNSGIYLLKTDGMTAHRFVVE